jgi:hypothetical protein
MASGQNSLASCGASVGRCARFSQTLHSTGAWPCRSVRHRTSRQWQRASRASRCAWRRGDSRAVPHRSTARNRDLCHWQSSAARPWRPRRRRLPPVLDFAQTIPVARSPTDDPGRDDSARSPTRVSVQAGSTCRGIFSTPRRRPKFSARHNPRWNRASRPHPHPASPAIRHRNHGADPDDSTRFGARALRSSTRP